MGKKIRNKQAELARIRTEDAIKNRAMKQLLFGKYVIKVPILKDERILDMPLPESYANPYVPPEEEPTILRLGGQGLVGSIIPELKHIRNLKEEKAKQEEMNLVFVNEVMFVVLVWCVCLRFLLPLCVLPGIILLLFNLFR